MIKPWTKVGGLRLLAEHYGKSMFIQNYINHEGKEVDFSFIKFPDWAMVLAITEDLYVVTVKQYRLGIEQISQELPAGTFDFSDESSLDRMKQELEQETGFRTGEVIHLGSYPHHIQSSPTKGHFFLALNCKNTGIVNLDPNEQIEVELVSLQDWLKRAFSGEIKEPWSCFVTLISVPHLIRKSHIYPLELSAAIY